MAECNSGSRPYVQARTTNVLFHVDGSTEQSWDQKPLNQCGAHLNFALWNVWLANFEHVCARNSIQYGYGCSKSVRAQHTGRSETHTRTHSRKTGARVRVNWILRSNAMSVTQHLPLCVVVSIEIVLCSTDVPDGRTHK